MDFSQLIIIAILVEAIWENCKMVYKENHFSVSMLASLIISVIICILAKADIFKIVGITIDIPIISSFLTGIICSRGANLVSDLFSRLHGNK
jgi:hypothetical protein